MAKPGSARQSRAQLWAPRRIAASRQARRRCPTRELGCLATSDGRPGPVSSAERDVPWAWQPPGPLHPIFSKRTRRSIRGPRPRIFARAVRMAGGSGGDAELGAAGAHGVEAEAEALLIDASVNVALLLGLHGTLEPRQRLGVPARARVADAHLVQAPTETLVVDASVDV